MASELQILGFERVKATKKNIKGTGSQRPVVALKHIPDIPCYAEVALQQISFWRTSPKDRHYGAHHATVDLDSTTKPTKVNFELQLRDQKSRPTDVWAYTIRALVIYYKK